MVLRWRGLHTGHKRQVSTLRTYFTEGEGATDRRRAASPLVSIARGGTPLEREIGSVGAFLPADRLRPVGRESFEELGVVAVLAIHEHRVPTEDCSEIAPGIGACRDIL